MARITISLPDDLLEDIDKGRLSSGETRSEFIRGALEDYFRDRRQERDVAAYIQGYLRHPETEEELGWIEAASRDVLAACPWSDEAE